MTENRIRTNHTGLSITVEQAVASVVIVLPNAQVTYSLPVASIEYLQLMVTAVLDVRKLHWIVKDSVAYVDIQCLEILKYFAEPVTLADSAKIQVASSKSDILVVTDSFARVCVFQRKFPEAVVLSDTRFFGVAKKVKDPVTLVEKRIFVFTKLIQDAFGFNEAFFLGDAGALGMSKGINNIVTFSDARKITNTLLKKDTVVMTDSGKVLWNSYTDTQYFADDYVGSVRTF